MHVLKEVSGTPDTNEVIGKVKSRVYFEELGAEILEDSMIIGENAYEVKTGWLGAPTSTFAEHRAAGAGAFTEEAKTDEDLLARFLLKNL